MKFPFSSRLKSVIVTLTATTACGLGHAQSFEQAVAAARSADAQYTAALAAVANRRVQASQAGAAFYPSAAVNYNQADVSASGRSTRSVSVTQPLLSFDRYLTLKQADPLAALAEVELAQADNDMALRVFTAMADIVRNREQIRALTVQIEGLEEQLRRSRRMRELGQGTVTEVSDFEVRVAVAQANRVSLRNALQAAERNFTLQTGLRADVPTLQVQVPVWPESEDLDALVSYVRERAPAARSAQLNVELARIASRRVVAQYLPQVSAQVARVQTSGFEPNNSSRVAVTLSAPLGVSPYYENQRAAADLVRAQENLRYAQDSTATEATRLYTALRSSRDEVRIRRQAVETARLAVDANVKSYQGGVKTNIDVISSYQALADAEVALVNTELQLTESRLRLQLLQQGVPTAL
ncbi:TolC family protein [Azohydromonas australica]|uniref:TolC family protein n=1 Tax=Azohydromonas australica TaxID=364039 RepID=UPI00042656B5|nr:TolC family protein [Azohydromonas australica]